jgi:hypothetical protein
MQRRLQADIARFRASEAAKQEEEEEEGEGGLRAIAGKAADGVTKVLIADFFVVLGFLG